ncbi:MAG: UDP-N-acetylglucosamine 1-carboxyvinyltransferase [Planctomycetes bacterium]|nr:UDP-N-acetylglucosamine 1-carboxyvinyltransferase [Planctomycetota bacterium]MCB9920354.1 UDP-N-acetylglucosamine 1-carboxyvinyltransferase [Planctomycetota bacterium]
MEMIRIRGGATLSGSVSVSGSKNASLPILAACLLIDGPVILDGVPHLRDVDSMLQLLENLGVAWTRQADDSLLLEVQDDHEVRAPYHLVRTMRASFCLLGPLWAKRGRAIVSYPGGCVFGHRPVDLHLKGLGAIGAQLELGDGHVHATGRVQGGNVFLGGNFGSTVLGTANVVMAAVLGSGDTVIDAAAQEPEVADLCHFLNACGADIRGIGSHRLVVRGVAALHGCRYRIIPDRIEAGTLLCAGVITRGEVEVLGARPEDLSAFLDRLRAAGVSLELGTRELPLNRRVVDGLRELDAHAAPRIRPAAKGAGKTRTADRVAGDLDERQGSLMADRVALPGSSGAADGEGDPGSRGDDGGAVATEHVPFIRTLPWDRLDAVDVATLPYPGFPTDLQAQILATMCIAEGVSVITEKVYPERFIHCAELARLGAKIHREGPTAIVHGQRRLRGAAMMASDLRASAALVLAGLVAEGRSEVRRVYHLDRGYEALDRKLARLGADVERATES